MARTLKKTKAVTVATAEAVATDAEIRNVADVVTLTALPAPVTEAANVEEPETTSGETVFIPLNKLKKSPRNARKTPHSETDIEAYAASIAAKGILTPGEIMQLPPDDEIVMVAGVLPVRAKKARYYEDARLKERLLPVPADPRAGLVPQPDDRSTLNQVAAPSVMDASAGKPVPAVSVAAHNAAAKPDDDPANAGLRREPGLEAHNDIAADPPKAPVNEFEPDTEEPDAEVTSNRAHLRSMQRVARQISMDPGDDMDL